MEKQKLQNTIKLLREISDTDIFNHLEKVDTVEDALVVADKFNELRAFFTNMEALALNRATELNNGKLSDMMDRYKKKRAEMAMKLYALPEEEQKEYFSKINDGKDLLSLYKEIEIKKLKNKVKLVKESFKEDIEYSMENKGMVELSEKYINYRLRSFPVDMQIQIRNYIDNLLNKYNLVNIDEEFGTYIVPTNMTNEAEWEAECALHRISEKFLVWVNSQRNLSESQKISYRIKKTGNSYVGTEDFVKVLAAYYNGIKVSASPQAGWEMRNMLWEMANKIPFEAPGSTGPYIEYYKLENWFMENIIRLLEEFAEYKDYLSPVYEEIEYIKDATLQAKLEYQGKIFREALEAYKKERSMKRKKAKEE